MPLESLLTGWTSHALLGGYEPFIVYLIVFLLLIVNAPEDPLLLGAGYLAALGGIKMLPLIGISIIGVVAGDAIIYTLGRTGSPLARKFLTPKRFAKVQKLIHRHSDHAAFFARFAMGARFWFQLAAGATKMSFRKFVFYDALGALVWVPVMTGLGFVFGGKFDRLLHILQRYEFLVIAAAIILIVLFIVRIERKERREHPEFRRHRSNGH
jgi:membrane protein DedA with SNARE-associated domain